MGQIVDNGSSGNFTAAGETIAGEVWQYLKLGYGNTGAATLVQTGSGLPVAVQGTVPVSFGGGITADTELPAAAAPTDATANPTVPGVGTYPMLWNGSSWDRVRGDTANGLDVDVTRVQGTVSTTAAQSGTWTVQPGNTANTTAWKVDASSVAVPVTDNAGSLTVDNAGTFAVQVSSEVPGTGATNLGKAEDAGHTTGDVGVFTLSVRNDAVATLTSNDLDYSATAVDAAGRMLVVNDSARSKTLKFASISVSSSGDNTIVSAVASKKIKVVGYTIVASAAVSCRWYSGAAGTALTGAMAFAANGGACPQGTIDAHLMETAVNTALVLNLSGATAVAGHISYIEEA